MTRFVANDLLWKFTDAAAPAEWKSKQARRVYAAAVTAEHDGSYAAHAVTGSVMLDIAPTQPFMSPLGTPADAAAARVRAHIAAERERLTRMEQTLAAYGGSAFVARAEAVTAPRHPFDAEAVLTSLMRWPGLRAFWVHGVSFVKDSSGAFVRA